MVVGEHQTLEAHKALDDTAVNSRDAVVAEQTRETNCEPTARESLKWL